MIATDAGGIHALRYGSMRRQVAGIEAVLADGTVVRQRAGGTAPVGRGPGLAPVRQRGDARRHHRGSPATGPGSAGAGNGARCARRRRGRGCRHGPCPGASSGPGGGRAGRRGLPRAGRLACRSARSVQRAGPVLLLEAASTRPMLDDLAAALQSMPGMRDAVVAADGPGRRRLWALREGVTEAISSVGIPHKLDVGLPLGPSPRSWRRSNPRSRAWTAMLASSSSATWPSATCTST